MPLTPLPSLRSRRAGAKPPGRRGVLLALLPLFVLALAAGAALVVARQDDERAQAREATQAAGAVGDLRRRIAAYTDVLYGVRGLYEASRNVTVLELHHHVRAAELPRRHPGVQVVGFAEAVPPGRERAVTARVRRDVRASGLPYPRFRVHPRPYGTAFAIAALEPQRGNTAAFGFDFRSEPARRDAVDRAVATGRPSASAPVRLIQERGNQSGFLIMLPVRRRRADGALGPVRGVAYAAFRMGDLVTGALGGAPAAELALTDLGATGGRLHPVRTYVSAKAPAAEALAQDFDVLGRRWQLRYAPRADVLTPAERLAPWALALGGLLVSVLLGRLLATLAGTERRALALAEGMTEDLRASQQELARSNAELERFAYVASHDLREPLRTVSGFVTLLERRHGAQLPEEAREWIAHAVDGTRRMQALIGELLEYSRAGREPGPAGPADLGAAFESAVADLAGPIAECDASVTAAALPEVALEPAEARQLLRNLIANALRYRSTAPPEVRVTGERRDGSWEIRVRDNGIGIAPRDHERIFVLFQRLHTRAQPEGTGMGLAICRKIAEARGGSIGVESEEGRGATFVVRLPAAEDAGTGQAPVGEQLRRCAGHEAPR